MSEGIEHKAFDKFFKERFGKHELNPPVELWKKIYSRSSLGHEQSFDEGLRDRYLNHKTPPPNTLWRKINPNSESTKARFFLKRLLNFQWIGIIAVFVILGIALFPISSINQNEKMNEAPSNIDQHSLENQGESVKFPIDSSLVGGNENEMTLQVFDDKNIVDVNTIASSTPNDKKVTNEIIVFTNERKTETFEYSSIIDPIDEQEYTAQNYDDVITDNLNPETFEAANNAVYNSTVAIDSNDNLEIKALITDRLPQSSQSDWSLAVYASPTHSYRTLSIPGQREVNEFYDNQKGDRYYSGGLGITYEINNSWSLNFGIRYNQLIHDCTYRNTQINDLPNISMDGVNKLITVNSSLNTVQSEPLEFFECTYPGGDPNNQDDYYAINYREIQKFRFCTIPITARYVQGKKKIKWLLDAGINTTILVSDVSSIEIATVHQPEEIVSFNDYHNVNTFGIQFTAGIGVKYDLKNRVSLILLPRVNYSLVNLSKTNYSNIKPRDNSVSVGIQYFL